MELNIAPLAFALPDEGATEVVERKGLGHPDTICDALAEASSLALSRLYLERFDMILHHNVDKVLLIGGRSAPAFGGGEVLEPIELILAGRATREVRGAAVPVEEAVTAAATSWLRERLPALDVERHVRIAVRVRAGSADLVELYERQRRTGIRLANDTSCGAGFAPLSETEQLTLAVEQELTSAAVRAQHPAIGADVKVMAVRTARGTALTVSCALVGAHLRDVAAYLEARAQVARIAQAAARRCTARPVDVIVNAADDPASGSLFLTVTGTSAEAGDDGEAGRGNRANGLITPFRPMTMESLAGKNPVTHVGKLYNLAAALIAADVASSVPGVRAAECYLVSRIGHPVDDPRLVDVRLREDGTQTPADVRRAVEEIVRAHLAGIAGYADALLDGSLGFDRWPLRAE